MFNSSDSGSIFSINSLEFSKDFTTTTTKGKDFCLAESLRDMNRIFIITRLHFCLWFCLLGKKWERAVCRCFGNFIHNLVVYSNLRNWELRRNWYTTRRSGGVWVELKTSRPKAPRELCTKLNSTRHEICAASQSAANTVSLAQEHTSVWSAIRQSLRRSMMSSPERGN